MSFLGLRRAVGPRQTLGRWAAPCPYGCQLPVGPLHFLDAGAATPEAAAEAGYCPELARRRNNTPAPHRTLQATSYDHRDRLAPSDQRIAARQDETAALFDETDYAEALDRALRFADQ